MTEEVPEAPYMFAFEIVNIKGQKFKVFQLGKDDILVGLMITLPTIGILIWFMAIAGIHDKMISYDVFNFAVVTTWCILGVFSLILIYKERKAQKSVKIGRCGKILQRDKLCYPLFEDDFCLECPLNGWDSLIRKAEEVFAQNEV